MQYKVPQNIDMEDKIIGPLTLTQFIYLLIGSLLVYQLLKWLGPNFLFVLVAVPLGIITICFAFIKIQNRPFSVFIVSAIRFMGRPKERIWQHAAKSETPTPVVKQPINEPVQPMKKNLNLNEINQYAQLLDEGGTDSTKKT